MILPWLMLTVALALSAAAAFYSIVGLAAIFSAAVIPVVIMGSILEIAKLTVTVWLHEYWDRAKFAMKLYLVPAVILLMVITSMGIFGFLSKAHLDQAVPTGEVAAQVSLIEEKISNERETIANARSLLQQLDKTVTDVSNAPDREINGRVISSAERALQIRRQQAADRARLTKTIEDAQARIITLQEQKAPIAGQLRAVEAKVGPIKYIAALIYGDDPDTNLLERAVRWVIIMLVVVFDPLAVMMLLAATESWRWNQTGPGGLFRSYASERPQTTSERVRSWKNKFNKWRARHANVDADNVVTPDLGSEPPGTGPVVQPAAPLPESAAAPVDPAPPTPEVIVAPPDPTPVPVEMEPSREIGPELPPPEISPMVSPMPTFSMEVDPPMIDSDDLEDSDDEDPVLKRARALWKDRNPGSTLKEHRRKFQMGEISQLPWMSLLEEAGLPMSTFGPKWPLSPVRGDQHIRTDLRPTQVFKYNGITWIPVDKDLTDGYSYNDNYINFLIDRISQGEYDPELLNDAERSQIEDRLKKDRK